MRNKNRQYIDLRFEDPRDDFRLSYLDLGNPNKKTLLLLHGGGFTGKENWMPFINLDDQSLLDEFHVILPDHRGHGHTNNPRGTFSSYNALASDMAGFIQQMDLGRPVIMGHSSGAATSLHLSVLYPELMSRQILIGVHPNFGISPHHRRGMEQVYGTKDYRVPPTFWQFFLNNPSLAIFTLWLHRRVNGYRLIRSAWPMWIAEWTLSRCDADPTNCDYASIACPSLIVWAKDEDFGSHEDHALLAEWIPGACYEFVSGDDPDKKVEHIFVSEQPELLRKAVWPFLFED